jgi:hypothetical protein
MAADLEARVKELEAKLQEMADREAIRDLRYRYHEYINEGKVTEIAALFSNDGELDFAHLGKARGQAEINKFFSGLAGDASASGAGRKRITWVKQFIHNHVVNLHGDHAHGFAYLEAKPIYGGEAFLVAARYDDDYVKQNGQWKFKKMGLVPYFMVPFKEGWAQENKIKMGM